MSAALLTMPARLPAISGPVRVEGEKVIEPHSGYELAVDYSSASQLRNNVIVMQPRRMQWVGDAG